MEITTTKRLQIGKIIVWKQRRKRKRTMEFVINTQFFVQERALEIFVVFLINDENWWPCVEKVRQRINAGYRIW